MPSLEGKVEMKNPLIRLRDISKYLSDSERLVAEYLLGEPDAVMNHNIRELADKLYVSPSTIVRFCKQLGFSGYREFRQAVIYELAMYDKSRRQENSDIARDDTIERIAEKITNKNILSLQETGNLIDTGILKKCVELLLSARNVLLFGIGASQCVAKDAYLKFLRLNKPCFTHEDWHAQLLMAKNATKKDVGIIISYSGETAEMVECMRELANNQTPTIAVTRFAPSTIASNVTYILYVSAEESVFRSGAISSRIAQLNVIDILYTAYASLNYDESMKYLQKTHIEKRDRR